MSAISVLAFMANHLWQSTVVGVIAAVLALILRENHARIRFWMWVTASIKFLAPMALFATLGGYAHSIRHERLQRPTPN
jgi:hypothetical protein